MVDTGSDLLCTQCEPCQGCYKQMNPKFNPKRSSTFCDLPCSAQECQAIGTGLCSPHNSCTYNYAHGSASLTQWVLAKETITLTSTSGEAILLKDIAYGCGQLGIRMLGLSMRTKWV